jgi:hypothetical protein
LTGLGLFVTVGVGRHVTAVEAAAHEIKRLHAIPVGGNLRIWPERVDARERAHPVVREMPAHPVRTAEIAVVRQRELGLLHQIIRRIGTGGRGIAGGIHARRMAPRFRWHQNQA